MAARFYSRLSGGTMEGDEEGHYEWEKKLSHHLYGEYSMALVQGSFTSQDRYQLVSGPLSHVPSGPTGVFVGIYDGHGGDHRSKFIHANLFNHLKTAITSQHCVVDPNAILEAYSTTEKKFMEYATTKWEQKTRLESSGSSCLWGVVHGNVLYVANAGDSRAVLARWASEDEQPVAHQLSADYCATDLEVQNEVQVTRAIGDVYLKSTEFNHLHLEVPIVQPLLKSKPKVKVYELGPSDRCVIFGSDGLWREVSNEEAVSIVKASPRSGAARTLLKEALDKASRTKHLIRQELLADKRFHSDISIVILFFDQHCYSHDKSTAKKGFKLRRQRHGKGPSMKYFSHPSTVLLRSVQGLTEKEALEQLELDDFLEVGEDQLEEEMAADLAAFTNSFFILE